MSLSETMQPNEQAKLHRLLQSLFAEMADANVAGADKANPCSEWDDELLQKVFASVVKEYAARIEGHREADGEVLSPFPIGAEPSATDVVRTVCEMLEAVDVAIFELGMWQALGSY